ncbi:hypothetical protein MKK60_27245, partial [Methylobacterium sp. J-092]|nr:hypothetical protein [Methylobacterium sp. J-092]
MGLERIALEEGTREEGTAWVEASGGAAARFDVAGFEAELIYHPKPAGKAGYDLPEAKEESAAAPEAAKVEPIAVRLASANVEK